MRHTYLVLAVTLLVGWCLSPAWACDTAGPNTHLGVITAVDAGSVTLKDAQTGKNLTFLASPQLLKGVAVKDQVAIVYTSEDKTLRATAITKAGG